MPQTWSGALSIDCEVEMGLRTILQGIVLKLGVTDQLQQDVIDINQPY